MIANLTILEHINSELRGKGVDNVNFPEIYHSITLIADMHSAGQLSMKDAKEAVRDIMAAIYTYPSTVKGVLINPDMDGACVILPRLSKRLKQLDIKLFVKASNSLDETNFSLAPN